MVEGTKSVLELLHSDLLVDEIVATSNWLDEHQAAIKDIRASVATADQLDRMTSFKTSSPVMALVQMPENKILPDSGWIIALDGINDPGNLGTIVRIADWYGLTEIVCSENTVDLYNPKALTSTMGSFSRVRVHYTNLVDFIDKIKLPVFACVMQGKSVYEVKSGAGIILIGSESHGISEPLLNLQVEKITIPSIGKAESLNAAVATAIVCDRLIGHHE